MSQIKPPSAPLQADAAQNLASHPVKHQHREGFPHTGPFSTPVYHSSLKMRKVWRYVCLTFQVIKALVQRLHATGIALWLRCQIGPCVWYTSAP
eukprot:scaffold84762_cov15-Tisochrysis_lutea.AAC.1